MSILESLKTKMPELAWQSAKMGAVDVVGFPMFDGIMFYAPVSIGEDAIVQKARQITKPNRVVP